MTQLNDIVTPQLSHAGSDERLGERRREILSILRAAAEPLAVSDVAQILYMGETSHPETDADYEGIERLYVQLYHTDMPMLAKAGLVDFDVERRAVSVAA